VPRQIIVNEDAFILECADLSALGIGDSSPDCVATSRDVESGDKSPHSKSEACLLEHRKPGKDRLHIHARIEVRAVAVGNVLVLVADREGPAVAVDDLDAAAGAQRISNQYIIIAPCS
jgi:recombinational DNA repair protein (RecF pathway)